MGFWATADDVETPLSSYERQIEITDILLPNGTANPNLRRLRVTVFYTVGGSERSYSLTTFISAIS